MFAEINLWEFWKRKTRKFLIGLTQEVTYRWKAEEDQKTNLGSFLLLGKLEMKERQLEKIREKQILSESLRQTEFLPHTQIEMFVKGLPTDLETRRAKGATEGGVRGENILFLGYSSRGCTL